MKNQNTRFRVRPFSGLAVTLLLIVPGLSEPAQASTPYGYVANAGWMGFAPSVNTRVSAGATYLQGFAYAANFGWIDLGDGTPANPTGYSNASATDYGVNHDGAGQLSGYAYAANIGWINFSWAGANDANRPRVDLVTGAASGLVYSANAGWINLNDLTMHGVTAAIRFKGGTSSPIAGSQTTLELTVAGTESLALQWFLNGNALSGGTGASHLLPSVQRFHVGDYSVRITREDSSTFDVAPVELDVTEPVPNDARLLSLSTRALSLTGDNVLIPGFAIDGTGTKRLLIRAVGPTLGMDPFNFGNALPDPVLTLTKFNGSTFEPVQTVDNWVDNANADEIEDVSAQLFAFGLQSTLDAALLADLAPGQYTVVASGVGNTTGIAIVELYDADDASTASMTAISNRGFAGVGNDVMIPGFVVSNEGPKTFLIRVVGPGLDSFGVDGTMADPRLTVFRREGNVETNILENDNWGENPDAANSAQIAQQVFAFGLPTGSLDAALVATLEPGVYTVVGSAADLVSSGVILVEVYVVE